MTQQELYDKAYEWVEEDNLNSYIVLTHHYNEDGKLEAHGEINAEYYDIMPYAPRDDASQQTLPRSDGECAA